MKTSISTAGIRRVAAFLLSVDKEVAAGVLRHLDPSIVTEVADAMTTLDPREAARDKVDKLWLELARHTSGPPPIRPKRSAELEAILRETFGPEQAARVVDQITARRLQEKPFAEIEQESPEILARVLSAESAAVSAVVLAHLDPSFSAVVLSSFEPDHALDVVRRIAALTPPSFEMLRRIAQDLRARMAGTEGAPILTDTSTRLRSIAEMLNFTAVDVEQSVLQGLSEEDEQVAQEIREYMFTWNDLASLDKRSMQKILGSIDTRSLAMSLKGCEPEVEQTILSNLSARVRDMVAEERDLAGPVPKAEVAAARETIMTTVRGLIESGEFSPARAGEDLVS